MGDMILGSGGCNWRKYVENISYEIHIITTVDERHRYIFKILKNYMINEIPHTNFKVTFNLK